MGSKASKITRATSTGARRYPSRLPEMPSSQSTASARSSSISAGTGPLVHPKAQASCEKDETIRQDTQDPDFQNMLRTIGSVHQQQKNPDPARNVPLSSQDSNTLHILSRRQILDDQQSSESLTAGTGGSRTWADTSTILQILFLRDDKSWSAEKIEKDLKLTPGFLKRLGTKITKP